MPKNIEGVKEDKEIDETAEGNPYDDELDVLYNEIFEDYKWYKSGDEYADEAYQSLIRNIKMFLTEIRRRNQTLGDYPRLIEILKDLLKIY